MKHLLILTVGICLLLTSVPAMADQAADEAAIRKVAKQIDATWNAHDAKACAAFNDEKYENWDGTIKGPAADEKMMADLFQEHKDIQRKMLEEIGIVFVTPDVAIYKFRMEITGWLDEDGKPQPPAKFLRALVLVKRNGKWLFVTPFNAPIEE